VAVPLEGVGHDGLCGGIFDAVEVSEAEVVVEFDDAGKVIVVRMRRDESDDALISTLLCELGQDACLSRLREVAVDGREVVAVVADVEHVGVTNGVGLDKAHVVALADLLTSSTTACSSWFA
jgi:hypothetical protein